MTNPSSDLRLWRLALVSLTPPPTHANRWRLDWEKAHLRTLSSREEDGTLTALIATGMALQRPAKRTGRGLVVVPAKERRTLERLVENFADLLAITEQSRRAIASPFPWIAFEPLSETARAWLDARIGIHELDHIVAHQTVTSVFPLDEQLLASLRDRADGVTLLAEVFAHSHPVGQLHEVFRLFERAFRLPARWLTEQLVEFLHPRFGYGSDEIDAWVALRDQATHADVRESFVLEADVRPFLGRMEQAATDVLLNKATWRRDDTIRRETWSPSAWTKSRDGHGVARLHARARTGAQLLDQFGAYPTDLAGALSHLPDGWWAPEVTPQSEQLPLLVLPEGQLEEDA